MQHKLFTLILIAAVLMLALAGCGKTRPPAASSESEPVTQQTEQSSDTAASATENLPADTEEPTAEVPREDETPEEEPFEEVPEKPQKKHYVGLKFAIALELLGIAALFWWWYLWIR